ncbi:MAG: hypothetical protein ETSY2_47535, partial [Candidatus Entotheonella gemina]
MKPTSDTLIFQPESALGLPLGQAEADPDMTALLEAFHLQESVILEKDDIIQKKSEVIDSQKKRIAQLEEYLRLARSRLYGRSSEKDSGQGDIFNEVELEGCPAEQDEDEGQPGQESPKPRKKKTGRTPFSASLARVQERSELSEEEKAGAIDTFFVKVREELDIVPAKVQVKEILQEKAVFPEIDAHGQEKRVIKVAELPKHPLPKSSLSISTLAWIIVSKYCDALPLYRQENILKRYGGSVTRTTMANSLIRLSSELQPLINLMREHQKTGPVIHADETRIQVIKETSKSINSDKYMW